MAAYGFAAEDRDPGRTYTPTHSSDEDLPQLSSLSLSERRYRPFTLRKDGRSWIQHSSSESRLSESEIKKRASRSSKASHSVAAQLQKMSPPRRNAVEDLVERVNRRDVNGDVWDLYAIHNDQPEVTKRTGEVLSFSIVLNKVNPTRQRTNSMSQERRRSAYISPTQEYAMPTRRGSKSYYTSPTNPIHDSNAARQSQSFRTSQTILENDPFGNATLFSKDGKPVVTPGTAAYPNAGLPPHIPLDEPIGAPVRDETEKKDGKPKKTKGNKDDDVIDLDALLGGSFNDDVLGGHSHDKHHKGHEHQDDDDFDFDSTIEIVGENHGRGRKQNEKGWGSKTPKQGLSRSRSRPKFKQQRFSSSMPRDGEYKRSRPEVLIPAGRRKQPQYYGSHGSATTASIHSDQSVLEAEYEEYSSSNSSHEYEQDDYHDSYTPATSSRYARATNYHRRGPPSPQQQRYEMPGDYVPATRRPRQERLVSEGAVARYGYSYSPHPTQRPPLITQHSAPRFTPSPVSAHPHSAYPHLQTPAYTYDTALTPYPSDLRRRDSIQTHHAEMYMDQERDKHRREIELLQRERDIAIREAEMHQEVARRASVSTRPGGGGSKYVHEPRLSRRYTEQYHG
ncbi:hypothetical protein LTS08_003315 [Lithohypha guttulata]|nr:hypothetical protein LTS08_003315 [Lithohypha guttulata]